MAIEGDKIPGGKSDDVPFSKVDARQLAMGAKVEMEHTKRKALAREIAKDHLEEIPDYYSRLKKMEDDAPKRKEAGVRRFLRMLKAVVKESKGAPIELTPKYKALVAADEKMKRRLLKVPAEGHLFQHPIRRTRGHLGLEPKIKEITGNKSLAQTPEAMDYGLEASRRTSEWKDKLKKVEGEALKRKEAMDPDHPYLLDQVGKPKLRKLSALPPDKSLRTVKTAAANTGVFGLPLERDPMAGTGQKAEAQKRLKQSQQVGVPKFKEPKLKPIGGVKVAALSYQGLRTAIGAGVGAAGGAAAGALAGGRPDEQGRTHRLRGALLGGTVGAAGGAAVGYAAPKYLASRRAGYGAREAVGHIGEQVRHDVAQVMQGAGQRVQRTGQGMQRTLQQEQHAAARQTAARQAQPAAATVGRPVAHVGTPAPAPAARTPITPPTGYVPQELPPPLPKAASVKLAFTESEYSGGTGFGSFGIDKPNSIPSFKNPPVITKAAGPPPPTKKAEITKMSAMCDELMKLNAVNATTPGGRLAQSRKVGQPRSTALPGPSIAQISKPIGYGQPIEGATKTGSPLPKVVA